MALTFGGEIFLFFCFFYVLTVTIMGLPLSMYTKVYTKIRKNFIDPW